MIVLYILGWLLCGLLTSIIANKIFHENVTLGELLSYLFLGSVGLFFASIITLQEKFIDINFNVFKKKPVEQPQEVSEEKKFPTAEEAKKMAEETKKTNEEFAKKYLIKTLEEKICSAIRSGCSYILYGSSPDTVFTYYQYFEPNYSELVKNHFESKGYQVLIIKNDFANQTWYTVKISWE